MTFAPASLVTLGKYLVAHGAVNLGIVGDTAHVGTGTSYHLGQSQLKVGAYSTTSPRDREPALTEAASAIDIGKVGGSLKGLQALSSWLSSQCQRRAIDTLDIREVIYSPDGSKVFRWDEPTQTVYPGGTGTGQGDDSHLWHTHVSWFRDAEFRDHTALFRRYFEEAEVQIEFKIERFVLDGIPGNYITSVGAPYKTDGVINPATGLPYVDYAAGRYCYSVAPASLLTLVPRARLSKTGDLSQDVALRKALFDYALPVIDCAPLVNAARQEGTEAGLRDGARAVKDAAVNAAVLLGG
jgi:hypothetical protein